MNICAECTEYHCAWLSGGTEVPGCKKNKYGDITSCPQYHAHLKAGRQGSCDWAARRACTEKKQTINKKYRWIVAKCIETGEVRRYVSMNSTRLDEFDPDAVSRCVHGKRKTHKGWTFEGRV